MSWCAVCCTLHAQGHRCWGELAATESERHGWRTNVDTPQGLEAYGVLVAPAGEGVWRARILTFPNVLWATPGGSGTMKFAARSAADAERQAVDYIRTHCRERGYKVRHDVPSVVPGGFDPERSGTFATDAGAPRVIRFLPVRFGVVHPSEMGGTGNLSATGIFVITNDPLDLNTRLRLMLEVDRKPLALSGDVRWMSRGPRAGRSPGMGVRLHLPPPLYADYVRSLG